MGNSFRRSFGFRAAGSGRAEAVKFFRPAVDDAEVDAVMEKAGREQDRDKRAALYREMQKLVVDEAPIAYLHTSPCHTVFNRDRVGNAPVDSIWGVCSPWDQVYIR